MTALRAADISDLAQFAEELADLSGQTILPHFRERIVVHNKLGDAGFDPVTEADRAAEHAIRAHIKRRFPSHGILGEEHGAERGSSPLTWVIDPIDGTRAFIAGLPSWGVLIALSYEGRPILGIMDQPYLDERYRGWNEGAEAVIRGATKPLRSRACASLGEALLSTTDPHLFHGAEVAAFTRVRNTVRLTRYGLDCTAYAMLAAGYIDCVIESGLKPFDIQALIPIIAGAGGGVCSWDGSDASNGGRVLAYGDARIRDEALELLRV